MAGKAKIPNKSKDGRGGARKGSDRPRKPPVDYDIDFKNKIFRAMQELAEEHGEPLEKAIVRMCYEDKVQDTVKVSIFNKIANMYTVKKSESRVEKFEFPKVNMPLRRPDPAKVIQMKAGNKEKQRE